MEIGNQFNFKMRARKSPLSWGGDTIELYALQDDGKTFYIADILELKQTDRHAVLKPFIRIEEHIAQTLMDDLWDCGLRPSEGSGSAGALKKTEHHLEDMRKIAFHKLGIINKYDAKNES